MSDNNSGDDWSGGGEEVFTETSHKSWFERIMDSLKAILFGFVLVIGAGALLFWNEGNSAKTAAALTEGAGQVVSVSNARLETANENKLVHVTGDTKAGDSARDFDLRISADGLKLTRKVEMYQWKEVRRTETRKKLGGGEETITRYEYEREWSERPIDSSRFRNASGHQNPPMPGIRSKSFPAQGVTLGAFKLDDRILNLLGAGDSLEVPAGAQERAQEKFGSAARVRQGGIYVGADPESPRPGDIRVTYQLLRLQPVSVVGKQVQGALAPFVTSNQRTVLLAETGTQDAALMFKHAQDANKVLTWILRAVGVLLMFVGFRMMLTLLQVLADFVPIFGDIVGFGASAVAMLATLIVAPVVIAIAWFYYRPLVAIVVLAGGAALFLGFRQLAARRAAGRAHAPVPYPGPAQAGAAQAAPRARSGFLPPGFGRK